MADATSTLAHHEAELVVEHARAAVLLLAAVEELRRADAALGARLCWDSTVVGRYQQAVARVQVAQESVDAFAAFEPGSWLS
jgi:hypothetical protein